MTEEKKDNGLSDNQVAALNVIRAQPEARTEDELVERIVADSPYHSPDIDPLSEEAARRAVKDLAKSGHIKKSGNAEPGPGEEKGAQAYEVSAKGE